MAAAGGSAQHLDLLERATEMLIANAVLSHASSKRGDGKAAEHHAREVERLADADVSGVVNLSRGRARRVSEVVEAARRSNEARSWAPVVTP